MAQLLHLDASARKAGLSRQLSAEFARAWRNADSSGAYRYRDLAAHPVPFIDEAWTELCDFALANEVSDPTLLRAAVHTPEHHKAWSTLWPLLEELLASDVILIGTPMYNYSVPASLKAWIDQVTFPRMMLRGRRVVVVSARGGAYPAGTAKDELNHQTRYLRHFFEGHMGIADLTFITAELSNAVLDPRLASQREAHTGSVAAAVDEARQSGRLFASQLTANADATASAREME